MLPQGQSKSSEFQLQFSSQSSILRQTTSEVRYHIGVNLLKFAVQIDSYAIADGDLRIAPLRKNTPESAEVLNGLS